MRKLVYDCINKYGICEKSVTTLALANAFKAALHGNHVIQKCVEMDSARKSAVAFGKHRKEYLLAKKAISG